MRKFAQFAEPILRILSPKRRSALLVICLFTVGMGLVEMGVAGSISLLGIAMSSPSTLTSFPGYNKFLELCVFLPDSLSPMLRMLIITMGLVCICITIKNTLFALLTWRQNCFSNNVAWDCMLNLYASYLRAPYVWHVQQNSADLQLYLTWKYYISTLINNVITAISQFSVAIILIGATVFVAGKLALLTFVIIAVVGIIIYRLFRTKAQTLGQKVRGMDEIASRGTLGSLHGIREVRIYSTAQQFYNSIANMQSLYVHTSSIRDLMGSVPQWILESLGMLLLLGVLICMAFSGTSDGHAVGVMTLLAAACWRMLPAVNKFLGALLCLKVYFPYLQKVLKKLDEVPLDEKMLQQEMISFNKSIVMQNVDYSYSSESPLALNGVSVNIPKGKMIGIVGKSGSGKSSLIGVLSGLLSPGAGKLLVDGKAVLPGQSLSLGYVPQSIYLVDATLAENVGFSDWGQSVDRARVLESCKMASLDVASLFPEGIDTQIGERGVRLSGGQIQRVGIARALYSRPDVLIFDESTSAMDSATESAIQDTILSLRANVTLIIVAHRLTTVTACDYVYWLDNGVIQMSGTANEILPCYEEFLKK